MEFIMKKHLIAALFCILAGSQSAFGMEKKNITFDKTKVVTIDPTYATPNKMFRIIAEKNNTPVGGIEYQTNSQYPKCYVQKLLILQEFQRQGIGTELIKKALQDMKISGCNEAYLQPTKDSRAFYEKRGFDCTDIVCKKKL